MTSLWYTDVDCRLLIYVLQSRRITQFLTANVAADTIIYVPTSIWHHAQVCDGVTKGKNFILTEAFIDIYILF